jgi:hypothetical protein
MRLDNYLAAILTSWGVKLEHKGACILVPADCAVLHPRALMEMLRSSNCPLAGSEQMVGSKSCSECTLTDTFSATNTQITLPLYLELQLGLTANSSHVAD